jgi:hypothetical protein
MAIVQRCHAEDVPMFIAEIPQLDDYAIISANVSHAKIVPVN